MALNGVFLASALFLLAFSYSSLASASIVEHTFHVENLTVSRLCKEQTITVVNGSLPGPTLRVREGDTLVVHVINDSPYNVTIHWHGIFQLLSAWADGPSMVTQCPIRPGHSYTYRFNVTQQEGTLWWHSHFSTLRATVYGALIIRPRSGHRYPFPKPHKEVPILLGEWWNGNVVDMENEAFAVGGAPNNSDAYTINGLPGDLYPCSKDQMFNLKVVKGKRYLLRIINAALNNQLFFKIANHKLTVVAVDASYTKPYVTDVIITGPGQTVDAILVADQPVGSYHMAARAYASAVGVAFDNTTTRGVVVYAGAGNGAHAAPPKPVKLPAFNDTPTVHRFLTDIKGLVGGPHWVPVPRHVDEKMHVTIGLGLETCTNNATCQGPFGQRLSAAMNNHSFQKPTSISMLEAFYFNRHDIYTGDFPDQTPTVFDYTNGSNSFDTSLVFTRPKSTSVKILRFNSTVEIVLQNTALIGVENHPMHIHGINFHVLGFGFGNYDPTRDAKRLNFFNPQVRNTVGVPVGGWTVIRFTANNPGVWFMHCHLDVHLRWGLATAFVVENGPTESTRLPPPPADLPQC